MSDKIETSTNEELGGQKVKIAFDDDDDHEHVGGNSNSQSATADKEADDAKGHTFRKRRLTCTKTLLADALTSPELQALADLDSNDDEDRDEKKDLPQDPTSIDNNKEKNDQLGATPDKDDNVEASNDSSSNNNNNNNSSSSTGSGINSNQLEARVLHASAPPIPKDCMIRRGNLLYVHHADAEEGQDEDLQNPSQKKRKLLESNNGDDDEISTTLSEKAEWKKKRHRSVLAKDESLPFPRHIVGTYSCHGIEPVYDESDQNPDAAPFIAKINQDRGGVAFPYANNSKMAVFAAYDGHGDGGEHVAQYALHEIPRRLELHDDFRKGEFEKAFQEVFVSVDRDLAYEDGIEPQYSGCTACVVLLKDKSFHIANAGDSRAVMARRTMQNGKMVRQALDMTVDQNPDSPGEQERIEEMGGFVSPPPEEGLSARVWLDCNYSQIGLAMSRSLGDHAVKSVGVIATPVVSKYELTESDDFMIIATDGVWEFMSSQEAVDIVSKHLDNGTGSSVACQNLIESAAGLWHENEGDYRDDITALVIKVKELWEN